MRIRWRTVWLLPAAGAAALGVRRNHARDPPAEHEESPEAALENRESHLHEHLRWSHDFAAGVIRRA
jgi:hypothetical protein